MLRHPSTIKLPNCQIGAANDDPPRPKYEQYHGVTTSEDKQGQFIEQLLAHCSNALCVPHIDDGFGRLVGAMKSSQLGNEKSFECEHFASPKCVDKDNAGDGVDLETHR